MEQEIRLISKLRLARAGYDEFRRFERCPQRRTEDYTIADSQYRLETTLGGRGPCDFGIKSWGQPQQKFRPTVRCSGRDRDYVRRPELHRFKADLEGSERLVVGHGLSPCTNRLQNEQGGTKYYRNSLQ